MHQNIPNCATHDTNRHETKHSIQMHQIFPNCAAVTDGIDSQTLTKHFVAQSPVALASTGSMPKSVLEKAQPDSTVGGWIKEGHCWLQTLVVLC